VVLKDGSSILAGNIWDFHQGKIGMGPGSTMLVKLNPQGVTVAENVFPGRNAVLAQAEDGQIVLIGRSAELPGSWGSPEMGERVADADAIVVGGVEAAVDRRHAGCARRVAPARNDASSGVGVIVFGNGFFAKSVLARYDAAGKQLWVSHPGIGFGALGGESGRFVLVQGGPDGATLTPFEEQAPNR